MPVELRDIIVRRNRERRRDEGREREGEKEG